LEKWIRRRKIRERGELEERNLLVWGDILVYGKVRKFWEDGGREETTVLAAKVLLTVLLTILLEDSHRGTVVVGNFGLEGQETVRIPGARESERLFLVGWEVNTQFGQFGHHQQHHQLEVEHQVEVNTLCAYCCYHYIVVIIILLLIISMLLNCQLLSIIMLEQ
jgi:hypothetical protein